MGISSTPSSNPNRNFELIKYLFYKLLMLTFVFKGIKKKYELKWVEN